MSPAPHFLLAGGSWFPTSIWDAVRANLTTAGYTSTVYDLVTHNRKTYDMTEDVVAIHKATLELIDSGRDVILVTHSYSSLPGSDALKDLSKQERTANGKPGGVVRFVIIAGWIVPEGFESAPRADDGTPRYEVAPEWMVVDKEAGLTTVPPQVAYEKFMNDLPEQEALAWGEKCRPWSIGASFSKATYAAWRDVPTTYVITTKDNSFFGGGVMRQMLEGAKASRPNAIDTTEEVESGHLPMLSQPVWVADMLKRAAAATAL